MFLQDIIRIPEICLSKVQICHFLLVRSKFPKSWIRVIRIPGMISDDCLSDVTIALFVEGGNKHKKISASKIS